MTQLQTSLVPIKANFILNDMSQCIQLKKKKEEEEEASGNPLIVSSLQDKCSGQRFTAKYQKVERSLSSFFSFFQPFLPLSASPRTEPSHNEQSPAFHLGGKNAPQAFQSLLPLLPPSHPPLSLSLSLSLTLHAFHLSEVDPREEITQSSRKWREGKKKKRKNPFFFTNQRQRWEEDSRRSHKTLWEVEKDFVVGFKSLLKNPQKYDKCSIDVQYYYC